MFSFVSKNSTECRIVRIFWNDGLLDLLAGAGIILMAMAWLADSVALGAVIPAVLLPFWKPLRNWITEPRRGFVELSDAQEGRNQDFLITSIAIGVAAFFICLSISGVVDRSLSELSFGTAGLPAFILAFLAVLTAAITSVRRFILYSGFLVVAGVTVSLLDGQPGWALFAGGLTIVIGGCVTLGRFLSQYPTRSDQGT